MQAKCKNELNYVIIGTEDSERWPYWNNDLGWVEEFNQATTFPIDILSYPLPEGATGVTAFYHNTPVQQFIYAPPLRVPPKLF